MNLNGLDISIIVTYLLITIVIGFVLKKKASQNIKSYFLGGNTLPWYMLGLSNASGMFDISGTMWMVTLMFVYGLKSIWIPWLWPVFNQIFMMVYLSAWLRRSNVLTGAEWISTRFGKGKGASMSHIIVVAFAIFSALGFLSYGFIGIGKFVEAFVPWSIVSPYIPFNLDPQQVPYFYGIIVTGVATLYVILGGMMSIVWTDVLQFTIMTVSCITIGVIAMNAVDAESLKTLVPAGWDSPFFGWELGLDWSNLLPSVNNKINADGFSLFTVFFMMMVFKGILASMAGPAPNYDMQKVLATKSPSEASKMSGFVSLVLLFPRYFMIAGFTILALAFMQDQFLAMGSNVDFEQVLPLAINKFVPNGLMGLFLAGLLAAFISTFASTVNAAPAYMINDIYLKYINPHAERKKLINYSYLISLLVVVISTLIGLYVDSINTVIQWIVSSLYGAYIAANVLKWHWWRFNGHGYFWGMTSGLVIAIIPHILGFVSDHQIDQAIQESKFNKADYSAYVAQLTGDEVLDVVTLQSTPQAITTLPELHIYLNQLKAESFSYTISSLHPLYFFPFILIISLLGSILAALRYPPTDEETLKNFYKSVRPWGFWKPIHDKVISEDPQFEGNKNFKRDAFNVLIGTIWQTALTITPIYIIIREDLPLVTSICILLITSFILKKNWYDKLKEEDKGAEVLKS